MLGRESLLRAQISRRQVDRALRAETVEIIGEPAVSAGAAELRIDEYVRAAGKSGDQSVIASDRIGCSS
jgi:hypothetical protein